MMNKERAIKGLVVFLYLFILICCHKHYDIRSLFPERLQGLKLLRLVKGKKAEEMVNRLHGKQIKVKNAWIGYYKGQNGSAVIWISEAYSSSQAEKQTDVMMQKILKGYGPFYNFKKKRINHTLVYIFSGLGKKHAVFCKQDLVFWITSDPSIIDKVVRFYIKKLG